MTKGRSFGRPLVIVQMYRRKLLRRVTSIPCIKIYSDNREDGKNQIPIVPAREDERISEALGQPL